MDCCSLLLQLVFGSWAKKQVVRSAISCSADSITGCIIRVALQIASHGLQRKRYELRMQVLWLRPAGL